MHLYRLFSLFLSLSLSLCFTSWSRYEGSSHDDVFGHLTNCSINKKSPFAAAEKDVIGGGCKWSLRRLKRWWDKMAALYTLNALTPSSVAIPLDTVVGRLALK